MKPKATATAGAKHRGEGREEPAARVEAKKTTRDVCEPVVPLAAYEHVREELDLAEELFEDAMAERAEG